MKRSLGTSLKKMGRDASNKYEKYWANKRVRKIANNLSMEDRVVGKPPVKQKKLFIIEERRCVYPHTFEWDLYADKEKMYPHWTEWIKRKAYVKKNARDNALDRMIRENKKDDSIRSSFGERQFRAVDLKKITIR